MPLSRNVLEDLLQRAEADLKAWIDSASKVGLADEQFRRHPMWRSLNARRSQIQRRIDSLAKVEAVDAETARRKAEPTESSGNS